MPSLRDSVPFSWLTPGLTSGAIVCRPFRDWGWVVWAASSPHATSLRTFVPLRNPQGSHAEYMGPSSGEERPPQDDKVLYGSGRGPGLAFVGFVPVETPAVASAA